MSAPTTSPIAGSGCGGTGCWVADSQPRFVLVALAAIGAVGFVVPRLGFWLARHSGADRATILPWISVLLFVVAWRLPNPDLAGTITFMQHAVGGGAACAVLGIYIASVLESIPPTSM